MRVMAYIHSLKDEDHNLHVLDEATIIKSIGNNIYLADYNLDSRSLITMKMVAQLLSLDITPFDVLLFHQAVNHALAV